MFDQEHKRRYSMFRLQKTAFALMVLALFAIGSVNVAHAQSTAQGALDAIVTANSSGTVQDGNLNQAAGGNFRFGYNTPATLAGAGAANNGFTAFDSIDVPTATGLGGGRIHAGQGADSAPSAFTTTAGNTSSQGDSGAGTTFTNATDFPGPYTLVRPGADFPPGSTISPAQTIVRFISSGAGTVTFTGGFQNDAVASGTIATVTNAGGGTVGATPGGATSAAFASFTFMANFTAAGQFVDFVFNGANVPIRFNVTAIPEPGTLLLLGISALGVGFAAHRRFRKGDDADESEVDGTCSA
jgi:hypothetical protein